MSTAVVTGASRGIGKACAIELAKAGYDVVVNYVSNETAAQEVVKEIEGLGRKALAIQADTSDLKAVQAMFRTASKEFDGIDVLVNNAGVVDDKYLLMLPAESLERSLDINIKGYFNCAQNAALKMMRKKKGCIINVSSVSSVVAIPGQSVYSATKGAVNAMTATLAKELAQYGIRVNAVAPGFIATDMVDQIPEDQKAEHLKAVPLGRFGEAHEVGKLVCALCSDDMAYITGQTIIVDGGLSL